VDDVIVVGGGPAGAMAAALLARGGARVRVFERECFPRPKLCGDTLNPGAMRILGEHFALDALLAASVPLSGMLLTGPGVSVRGDYGSGLAGRSIPRREFDQWLLAESRAAGVDVEHGATVRESVLNARGVVSGVIVGGGARAMRHQARLVIAADGRASAMARRLGLARHPRRPRRWAIGGYFEGVTGLTPRGEMHVRRGHYIGVAPVPGGLANACLVRPHYPGEPPWPDPAAALVRVVTGDPLLGVRFRHARLVARPQVLGPMAVDAAHAGAPGLLLAGDAAGFIDPMTGDGLRLALASGVLAAQVAGEVLGGTLAASDAPRRLTQLRGRLFGAKWRFNRSLRALVASPRAVTAAAAAAHVAPSAFAAMIRYAGDC
jgi:flavin-dependent dehydrogenase